MIVWTVRSDGGGTSKISGVAVAVALLASLSPSNTAPRGLFAVGGSVITITYQGPESFCVAWKVAVTV